MEEYYSKLFGGRNPASPFIDEANRLLGRSQKNWALEEIKLNTGLTKFTPLTPEQLRSKYSPSLPNPIREPAKGSTGLKTNTFDLKALGSAVGVASKFIDPAVNIGKSLLDAPELTNTTGTDIASAIGNVAGNFGP